ncbi:MAG: LamG domain-containing protein, partial [Planctomycetota bacterium]
ASEPHRGFYLYSGEGPNSVVAGLTVTGGYADAGGGVCLEDSGATIRNCRIIGNKTKAGSTGEQGGNGGGIYCFNSSSVVISGCEISGNITGKGGLATSVTAGGDGGYGGGIYCGGSSSVVVEDCNVSANTTGDGDYVWGTGWVGGDGGDGGGLYCDDSSLLTVSDSVITGNQTGDGKTLTGEGGDGAGVCSLSPLGLDLTDCIVSWNIAGKGGDGYLGGAGGVGGDGGGVYCYVGSLTGCTVSDNIGGLGGDESWSLQRGGNGGGLHCNGSLTIIDCNIAGNIAGEGGSPPELGDGGPGGKGGGVYCISCWEVTIEGCEIVNNSGGRYGLGMTGAVGGHGGGVYCESCTAVTIDSSSIVGNKAGDGGLKSGGHGGGIYCDSASITNCTIAGNRSGDVVYWAAPTGEDAGGYGGGVNCGSATISNCLIVGNATGEGGYNSYGYSDGGDGAGIYCRPSSSAVITSCTIANNITGEGHVERGDGGGVYATSGTVLLDSVIWGNEPNEIVGQSCSNVSYSDIADATCSGGTGIIDADPCFIGPGYWADANDHNIPLEPNDPNAAWVQGDYHLSQVAAGQGSDSPCVDAGSDTAANLGMDDSTTRTDGRRDQGVVDMGYHYALDLGSADLDGNWHVDLFDFDILGGQWMGAPGVPSADIAPAGFDGIVDGMDLGWFTGCWLDCYVTAASAPTPAAGQGGVDPNGVLMWRAGDGALEHDVYLGTSEGAVASAGLLSDEFLGTVADANFDPCGLDSETTYYWRIDEVGPACTTGGDVWSFTTWAEFDPNLGLVSWWKFDEGSGGTAYDSVGSNDGTVVSGPNEPNWTGGQIGGALSFDGVDDYVDVGDKASLEPGSFTICAWIRPDDVSSAQQIAGKYGNEAIDNHGHGYKLEVRSNGKASLMVDPAGGGNSNPLESTTVLSAGQWYFVAGTYDGLTARIYINGVVENSVLLRLPQCILRPFQWSY